MRLDGIQTGQGAIAAVVHDLSRAPDHAWANHIATANFPTADAHLLGQTVEHAFHGEVGLVGAEATKGTVADGGWIKTGDAGYLDADGYMYIHDRVKDMIITGGENVYPAEVESAIYGHPDILEVAVIGVPDAKWGEAVKAICVPKPGAQIDPESVIGWARERIAGFKVPRSVDIIAALPRNASGKILRKDLRAPYWAGFERQVN